MTTEVERVYPPKIMVLVANPAMRRLLKTRFGKRVPDLALLGFQGRKSGRRFEVVISVHDIDGAVGVLTNSPWRHNFTDGHPVAVTRAGVTSSMTGRLVSDPDAVAAVYRDKISELGPKMAPRRLGIAIRGDSVPSEDALSQLARSEGLSIVMLEQA